MAQQYKYYLSKQFDLEEYYEGEAKENCNAKYLVIRVHKSGKTKNSVVESPYCDYEEMSRKRIKAPKGYLKRLKKRLKDPYRGFY